MKQQSEFQSNLFQILRLFEIEKHACNSNKNFFGNAMFQFTLDLYAYPVRLEKMDNLSRIADNTRNRDRNNICLTAFLIINLLPGIDKPLNAPIKRTNLKLIAHYNQKSKELQQEYEAIFNEFKQFD
jgi:hypothetical protein